MTWVNLISEPLSRNHLDTYKSIKPLSHILHKLSCKHKRIRSVLKRPALGEALTYVMTTHVCKVKYTILMFKTLVAGGNKPYNVTAEVLRTWYTQLLREQK